jgi:hypothetical protein
VLEHSLNALRNFDAASEATTAQYRERGQLALMGGGVAKAREGPEEPGEEASEEAVAGELGV